MMKAKAIGLNVAKIAGLLGMVLLASWIWAVMLDRPISMMLQLFVYLFVIVLIGYYIVWFIRKARRTRAARMRKLDNEPL